MMDRNQTLSLFAAGFLALAGCREAPPDDAGTPSPRTPRATSVTATTANPMEAMPPSAVRLTTTAARSPSDKRDAGGSVPRDCLFVVDGKTRVDGSCLVFPMGNHGYTLNAWSDGKPRQSHFAVVIARADGTGEATWNADPDDDRASDSLGSVKLENGCWTNARVRICARR